MALPVLLFLLILLTTFGVAVAMTRPSPQEKLIGQRMASIHQAKSKGGASPRDRAIVQGDEPRQVWLAG